MPGAGAVSHFRIGPGSPGSRMGVLPTIFTHTRWIILDIAGIVKSFIEGRREEQAQVVVGVGQTLPDMIHCPRAADLISAIAEYRPGLRDCVNLAFIR